MRKRVRMALSAAAALVALAFVGEALAAYNPRITVSSSPGSITIGYRQANEDDATAVVTFFAPAGAQPDLSQAHYRLAQLYQRTGQKELAAKELEVFRQLTK